jgi:L-threonylcarbamoyladenylate synthase
VKSHWNIEDIERAARIISDGGLVAFPTETVYGLGANALNPVAVAKIFKAKERPTFDPLIVHIASLDDLKKLTSELDEKVMILAERFWPGPLTMVLPKSDLVPDLVTSDLPTVGIRMPDHPVALELIRRAGCPIAAPSANKFGQLSPTTAAHVRKQLPHIDYILDGGKTAVGIESTIVSVEADKCVVLRPGRITPEEIRAALPGVEVESKALNDKIVAPGLLKSHYSPKKPLFILSNETQLPAHSGLILHSNAEIPLNATRIVRTSENKSLLEVASGLFAALHTLEDDPNISQIWIEAVPETGLGVAIMDRMKKAAFQYQE